MTENDKHDKRGAVLRCFYLCEMVLREKVGMCVDGEKPSLYLENAMVWRESHDVGRSVGIICPSFFENSEGDVISNRS